MNGDWTPLTEDQARASSVCCGCDHAKDRGCVVCWHCFKRCARPLKYFTGTFADWQRFAAPSAPFRHADKPN